MSSPMPEPWPSIPTGEAARRHTLHLQLEHTQWLPPEVLLARQIEQLAPLIEHAALTAPAWGPRLEVLRGAPLTMERLRRVPLLQRVDLQRHRDPLRSTRPLPAHGKLETSMTSGSTGRPVEALHSQWHQMLWNALTMRQHHWFGRDLSETYATIRFLHDPKEAAYPEGKTVSTWDPVEEAGQGFMLNLATPIPEQVEWLLRRRPAHLQTFPTNLHALARHFHEHGLVLPGLKSVYTLSETVTPDLRDLVRTSLGVEIRDTYSSQEVGYMALECPEGGYHVQSEAVLLEVLDADGAPCAPGEVGRVVVTALHNWASPLIRYENGDHAQVGEPCRCGRGLPTLARVLGRTRNRFLTPDGGGFWPAYKSKVLLTLAPYEQMQLVQTTLQDVEVRLVAPTRLTEDHFEAMRAELSSTLAWPFRLHFVQVDEIARSKSGKFEDCICLL